MKKILITVIISFTLIFYFSCDGSYKDKATVTFVIGGTASNANIEYSFDAAGGSLTTLTNQSIPWQISTELESYSYVSYLVSLCGEKVTADNSTIYLQIFVNGTIQNTVTFSDENERQCIQVGIYLHGYDD